MGNQTKLINEILCLFRGFDIRSIFNASNDLYFIPFRHFILVYIQREMQKYVYLLKGIDSHSNM